jgi:hypothetical protein
MFRPAGLCLRQADDKTLGKTSDIPLTERTDHLELLRKALSDEVEHDQPRLARMWDKRQRGYRPGVIGFGVRTNLI